MRIFTINNNDAGQRLDKYLIKAVKAMPQSFMYKAIRTKKIKVNRRRTSPDYILVKGDTVQLFIKDEFFTEQAAEQAFMTLTPNIDVVFENNNIIICDKRPGLICHSDNSESINTLINHIKAYLYRRGEYDPASERSFAPALCNRIDRNTGGLVIAAKNAEALRTMNEKIKNNEVTKKYLCAVHGNLPSKEDTLTGYLIKDADKNTVTIYKDNPKTSESKRIITKYNVLTKKNNLSLLEVELITGRTHQIRAQMAAIGNPLLGDGKYGINRADKRLGYKFQALYSYYLAFDDKVFTVNNEKIWFLREFDSFNIIR